MQSCNVISNKQNINKPNDNNYGLISSWSPLTINNSCIFNNIATIVIAIYYNYELKLVDTYFDKENAKTGTIVVQNGPNTLFINALIMYETGKCIASFNYYEKAKCYKSPCNLKRGYISFNLILVIQCCLLGYLPS